MTDVQRNYITIVIVISLQMSKFVLIGGGGLQALGIEAEAEAEALNKTFTEDFLKKVPTDTCTLRDM